LVGYAQTPPLNVIATTTLIADVAVHVGGDLVEVTALVPPDADTHSFNPNPRDVALVSEAQVVLVNGANLEATLLDVIENAATVELTIVSQGVDVLAFGNEHAHEDEEDAEHEEHGMIETIGKLGVDAECDAEESHDDDHQHGGCDPHFWGNPQNVMVWAENIAEVFAAADPDNAEVYRANAAAYQVELTALDAEIESLLSAIPDDARILVTNHEFLGYFAARYDFEVVGTVIPGGSTLAEPAPQAVAALIETIKHEGVQAIFVEVSDVSALANVIAGDTGDVAIVTLYSESLSAADGPAATYLDYMRYNAGAIADALSE
jgi:ABC-type Zn uptake system ZnuABC Zn-binding protein ZnuA